MNLTKLHHYKGVFAPENKDDLKESARSLIGKEMVFEASWIIDEGIYEGQWAMTILQVEGEYPKGLDFFWVPECDVKQLEQVERVVNHIDTPRDIETREFGS